MNETPSKPGLSLETDAMLVCCACGYDLRGLPHEGVCPECAMEVQSSIHAAIEAEYAARTGSLPLPSWLRIAKSGYLAAAVLLLSAPWVLPFIAEGLGLPASTGRKSQFPITLGLCCMPAALFGFVLGALLAGAGSRWSLPVFGSSLLVLFMGWQGFLVW